MTENVSLSPKTNPRPQIQVTSQSQPRLSENALSENDDGLDELSKSELIALVRELRREKCSLAAERDKLATSLDAEEEHITNKFIRRISELRAERGRLLCEMEEESERLTNHLQSALQALLKEREAMLQREEEESEV